MKVNICQHWTDSRPLLYLYLYEEDRRIRVDAVVLRAG